MTLSWAIHSLSGVSSPANAAYSEAELLYQLKSSGAKALFTCLPLLKNALGAAHKAGIPKERVYLFSLPKQATGGADIPKDIKTLDQLVEEGNALEPIPRPKWTKGQGARQTAFLCYSSGTSGLPVGSRPFQACLRAAKYCWQKGVMISHRNVISNVLQIATFDGHERVARRRPGDKYNPTAVILGLLPQSHIYGLVVISHLSVYRGDQVINLPKFEFAQFLNTVQRFKIEQLYLVRPMDPFKYRQNGLRQCLPRRFHLS